MKKRELIIHPNRDRVFKRGEIHDARPSAKSHRHDIDPYVIELADSIRKLAKLFNLDTYSLSSIVKDEFGQGLGNHTTDLFLNSQYGPGFRPRAKTLRKYEYLKTFLEKKKKEFAKGLE